MICTQLSTLRLRGLNTARRVFPVYARRAVSLASSSVNCFGPMAFFAAYSRF